MGIRFKLENKNKSGWRYYQGEWNLDMPNGMGKTVEEILIVIRGNKKLLTTKSSVCSIWNEGEEIKVILFRWSGMEKGKIYKRKR